jgi:hypothetical protein
VGQVTAQTLAPHHRQASQQQNAAYKVSKSEAQLITKLTKI